MAAKMYSWGEMEYLCSPHHLQITNIIVLDALNNLSVEYQVHREDEDRLSMAWLK